MSKRDFLGQELVLGDYVIFMKQHYREFGLAKVIKFTPQKVRVKYGDHYLSEILQTSDQLVKVSGEEVFAYALKNGIDV
jgi:intein-encoded DNA endonuclease-like protein